MTIPDDITAVLIELAPEEANVGDFTTVRVRSGVPAVKGGVGRRLKLLMRNQADLAIGIKVMIGTAGNTAKTQICPGIGHHPVDRLAAHGVMPGTQTTKRAPKMIQVGTQDLPPGGEDKEDLVERRSPAIGLHGKLYFLLNLRFRELAVWIGPRIHPGATQNRVDWVLLVSIGVLRDVVIERRAPNIVEVLQDQAVVVGTDIGGGGFPKNGVGRDAANHDATPMIAEIACRIERDLGVCLVRARQRCGSRLDCWQQA